MRTHITAAALCSAAFFSMNGVGAAVAALPEKLRQLSGSVESSAWLASAFAASYVLLQIPVGRLADKIGFRLLLISGFSFMAVSGLCFAVAETPLMLFVGRFIQGAGEAPVWAAAPALLTRLYPNSSGRMIGLYGASFQFGLTTGPLTGLLLAGKEKHVSPFAIHAILCMVCTAAAAVLVHEPVAANDNRHDTNHDSCTGSNPRINSAILFTALPAGGGYGLTVSCIPAFLIENKGFSADMSGMFFMLTYLAFGTAQFTAGTLSDRWERRPFIFAGAVSAGLGIALFPALTPFPALALLAAAGFGLGGICTVSLAALCENSASEHRGSMSGRFFLFWGLGYFIIPLIVQKIGMETGGLFLAGLLLSGATAVLLSSRRNSMQ